MARGRRFGDAHIYSRAQGLVSGWVGVGSNSSELPLIARAGAAWGVPVRVVCSGRGWVLWGACVGVGWVVSECFVMFGGVWEGCVWVLGGVCVCVLTGLCLWVWCELWEGFVWVLGGFWVGLGLVLSGFGLGFVV